MSMMKLGIDRERKALINVVGDQNQYVCACLKLTHADLVRATAEGQFKTLKDLRERTGAGDGCMACHHRLSCYMAAAPAAGMDA
jgi:bacterioferritin-associated ferredoxin